MPSETVANIQKRMKAFDAFARAHEDPGSLQSKWESLFHMSLPKKSAHSFAEHYRNMKDTRKHRKQRGGVAPLDYVMTPGSNVGVYGRFPTEIGTDPASIRDLDVYLHDALTMDCGSPSVFPTPPVDMGSNKVGGKRGKKNTRRALKQRKTLRKQRLNRRRTWKARGGNLATSLAMHPYLSSTPPNVFQAATNMWSGNPAPVPFPSSPVVHKWDYVSNGTTGLIDPGLVTHIGSDFQKLASPAPWQDGSASTTT